MSGVKQAMKFMNAKHESNGSVHLIRALWWYLASAIVLTAGFLMAARYYPGGFDWAYTVVSALASQKHNPEGSAWFSVGNCNCFCNGVLSSETCHNQDDLIFPKAIIRVAGVYIGGCCTIAKVPVPRGYIT